MLLFEEKNRIFYEDLECVRKEHVALLKGFQISVVQYIYHIVT